MNNEKQFDQQPEVSIIVPVYNMQRYLRQCLESIKSQTFKNWECVIVDDGSTDASGKICDEFAQHDSRFKVMHVKNGGLSSARNNGIKQAIGQFITFCDSDDWYSPETIEKMHRLLLEYDADCVQIGRLDEFYGHRKEKPLTNKRLVLDRHETLSELMKEKRIRNSVWNKMFRRELIGPDFPEGKVFEDVYVNTLWYPKFSKTVIDPTPLYHYRLRKNSILHSGSTKNWLDYYNNMRFRADEFHKLGLEIFSQTDYVRYLIRGSVRTAKCIARYEKDRTKRMDAIEAISDDLKHIDFPSASILGRKLWLRATLLRKYPEMFVRLMRVSGSADIHTKFETRSYYP